MKLILPNLILQTFKKCDDITYHTNHHQQIAFKLIESPFTTHRKKNICYVYKKKKKTILGHFTSTAIALCLRSIVTFTLTTTLKTMRLNCNPELF